MPLADIEKPIGYFKEEIVYIEKEIKAMYSNTSFPTPFVAPTEFTPVFYTPNPATDLQIGTQDGTEIDSKGNRVIKWAVRDKTVEELEAERKASVPTQITPRQLRLQLLAIGLLDDVETLCAEDRAMSIWFEYSLDFQRNHEMTINMGIKLGLSYLAMDTFFIEANKL